MKSSGTIEVLQRYVKALCFLDVFEWWCDSGTPEVRMRYADTFLFEDDNQKLTRYSYNIALS